MRIDRRGAMAALGGTALALAGCAGAGAGAGKAPIVLVHGAWHGAWCWSRVAPLLQEAGHPVHTPTLPGQGERAAELSDAITLESHVAALADYIDSRGLRDVVLVGHSYGGIVITGAADRIGGRIGKLVYLDAVVLGDGESIASVNGANWAARLKTITVAGGAEALPAPAPSAFGVLRSEDQAWVASLLTPQPLHTFDRPLRLDHAFGNGLPRTYIDCTTPAMPSVGPSKARVRQQAGWTLETLPCGHDAMVVAPGELGAMLVRLA